jgi:3-hydroxyisobutyrate dehydrogenase
MSATIGVIGIGRMGRAICTRLAGAGFEVVATDRRPEREADALDRGARWVADIPAVVAAVDVVLTVLPGTEELEAAGATAIPALGPGLTWIEMTSAAPGSGSALLARAEQRGAECLVATLGGGVDDARAGTVQLFAGGASDAVERHRPLLETLGTVEHVGDHGAAYLTKLLVNLLWFAQGVALGEALLLAARDGVDLEALIGAIGRSAAGSELVRNHGKALLRGDHVASFELDRCCEELDAVVDHAAERGVPNELAATVSRAYRDALARYGPVDGELLAVAALEERAGIRLSAGGERRR